MNPKRHACGTVGRELAAHSLPGQSMARPRLLVSWLWMASVGAWHVEDLRDALQRFLDDRAGPYAASLAVVGDGYEVAVAAGARPGDAFAFGSGTKPFVAAAVLRLVEAGVVGLDDAAGPWIDPALDALAPGQHKRAKFPTSKAPISAVFHSFRLTFGRAIISRNGLEAWMLFSERARAEHSR